MLTYENVSLTARCPACHGSDGRRLYSVNAAEAAQAYVLAEAKPARNAALAAHIETLWGRPTAALVRCDTCGFTFADPYVAGDAAFYSLAYERSGYRGWTWEYGRTRERLEALVRSGALRDPHVLEVGAGDGVFVRSIAPTLTDPGNVLCTEFSEYGRREIEKAAIEALPVDVRSPELDPYAGRFDVVCLFQVLEHLDRLDALFERFNALTGERAHLFAAVPNEARIAFNEHHGSLLDLPPNHVGRWTRTAFETISDRHGWRVAEFEVEPDGPLARVRQYVTYRFMRRRQDPRSLANRVERVRQRPLRLALKAATAAAYGVVALPTLAKMVRADGLGDSVWVHLERVPAPEA